MTTSPYETIPSPFYSVRDIRDSPHVACDIFSLVPLPRVTALTSIPRRYSKDIADPSSFGWTTNLCVAAEVILTKK